MPRIDIVATDADPAYLNQISLQIFQMWREFAIGHRSLGGEKLIHPSGKYAASISLRRYGSRVGVRAAGEIPIRVLNHVAIIVNEEQAPESVWIEHGHKAFSMLPHLQPGRSYPISRWPQTPGVTSGPAEGFPSGAYGRSRVRHMWSESREASYEARSVGGQTLGGYARTPTHGQPSGSNRSGTGPAWTVPAMPAYAPAQHLVELFENEHMKITAS